jgi:hypothetical protein
LYQITPLTIAFPLALMALTLVESFRTARYVAVAAVASFAFAISHLVLPAPSRLATGVVITITWVGVVVLFERSGLGAMTRAERELRRAIESILWTTRGDPPDHASRREAFDDLLAEGGSANPFGRVALRLFRRSAVVGSGPTPIRPAMVTAHLASAYRYLGHMRRARLLGYRLQVRPIDEDRALRAYLDDFRECLEAAPSGGLPGVTRPTTQAAFVLAELAVMPTVHARSTKARNDLVTLLSIELKRTTHGDSRDLVGKYASASERMHLDWAALRELWPPPASSNAR